MRIMNCGVCGQDGHENKEPGWECIDALNRERDTLRSMLRNYKAANISTEELKMLNDKNDSLKAQLERAKDIFKKMCRESLDDEGMGLSDRTFEEVWNREVVEGGKF